MRKIALVLVLTCIVNCGFAQLGKPDRSKLAEKQKLAEILNKYRLAQRPGLVTIIPKNNKGTAIPLLQTTITKRLVGPTINGNELYVVEPYKMPCVAPGKGFISNMPVVGAKAVVPVKPEEK